MLNRLGSMFRLSVCVCAISCAANARASSANDTANLDRAKRDSVQHLVDELKARLSIPQTVMVSMVTTNPRLLSVERAANQADVFVLSVEQDFADVLSEQEMTAAVAHELGHVWIFTHFPFLQTEDLANDIAARVVSRDSFAPLYEKVWKRTSEAQVVHQQTGELRPLP